MLTHNLNITLTRSSEIIPKTEFISSITPFNHIPCRLNNLLLSYDPQTTQSKLLIPYKTEDINFISAMKSLYTSELSYSKNDTSEEHSFLFYNIKDNSMLSCPYIKGGYDIIGQYALSMLSKELNDSQRVYYYKLLMKYFEQCSKSKVPANFFEKYLNQICKDVFNYNKEVGFQVISNFLYLLNKLKNEKMKYAKAIHSVLSQQFLSLFIMYKTWYNEKIRNRVIEMIKLIRGDLIEMNLNKNEMCALKCDLKKEIDLLESLCDHICIREEIKKELRLIFNQSNIDDS